MSSSPTHPFGFTIHLFWVMASRCGFDLRRKFSLPGMQRFLVMPVVTTLVKKVDTLKIVYVTNLVLSPWH
jgi:hypothetical protein